MLPVDSSPVLSSRSIICTECHYATLTHSSRLIIDGPWTFVIMDVLVETQKCTVRRRYNAVNFITNIHKRHAMARPLGRGMGCLLWIQHLIDIMSQFLQLLMQNLTILDRVITALDCICALLNYSILECYLKAFFMEDKDLGPDSI